MKIFGIGLSRTGTKSLTAALEMLGFKIAHYPCDRKTFQELTTGMYNLSLLEEYDGITDITVVPFYPQLDALYPGSKFILTLRGKEAWLASMENHFGKNSLPVRLPDFLYERKIRRFLRAAVYGSYAFNRERLSYVYDSHLQNARQYFRGSRERLLEINITAGEGWGGLCPFLNRPIPTAIFPRIK